jgi:hypothetical protein
MTERRYVFTVTTGRSGTGYLAYVLSLLRNVQSYHEPEPNFAAVMRDVQVDPSIATHFLLRRKLPHYAKVANRDVYVETSHLFCKGFLNAWLEISELPVPDLVVLRRPPRKVAKSMMRLNTVPGRTEEGLRWYLAPSDPSNFTLLQEWKSLCDYQLCYWYCLEIGRRQESYAARIEQQGGKVVECTTSSIATWSGFNSLRKQLNLPLFTTAGLVRYIRNAGKRINSQAKYKNSDLSYTDSELDHLEAEVVDRTLLKDKISS